MKRILSLLVSILATSPIAARAGSPAHLRSTDPLLLRTTEFPESVDLGSDPREPGEKLVGSLRHLNPRTPDEPLDLVITLREPGIADLASRRLREDWTAILASIAHRFSTRARSEGLQQVRGLSHLPIVFGTAATADLLRIAALPEVLAIESNRHFVTHRTEGGALVAADRLRSRFGATGRDVGVAIIDSGVDDSHPEFDSRVVVEGDYTETTGDGTIDEVGHGTAVAGIIAGSSGGLAPEANIWALKVFDAANQSSEAWVLAALNDALAARNSHGGLDVINMSFGDAGFHTDQYCDDALTPALATAVRRLSQAGIIMVASTGNDAVKNGVTIPACLTSTISVGAVYDAEVGPESFPGRCADQKTVADKIGCFSNSGRLLDVLAPSFCARTTAPDGGYDPCFGGTSAAAAYVSGVAAQVRGLRPTTGKEELLSAFRSTGRARSDVNGLTRRRIDAEAAYEALSGDGTDAGLVSFSQADFGAFETDASLPITVVRTGGANGTVAAQVQTVDGTAIAGDDYVSLTATVAFEDGEAGAKSVPIPLLDDAILEGNETFGVALSSPTGGLSIGSPNMATVTLSDDDLPDGPCAENDWTACLLDDRFQVQVRFEDPNHPERGYRPAPKIGLSDNSTLFYFFDENNVEMLLKVLDACSTRFDAYWVFYAATTNVAFDLVVVDTEASSVRTYRNPAGHVALPVADTRAFRTCPGSMN